MEARQEGVILEELRCTSSAVETIEEARVLINILESHIDNGYSLSAPELGIKAAIAIIRMPGLFIDLINPIILMKEAPILSLGEFCFSFPQKRLNCIRHKHIVLRNGLSGDSLTLMGQPAILAQHQIDHLQGVVFYDKVIKLAEVHQNGELLTTDVCPCGSRRNFAECCMIKI